MNNLKTSLELAGQHLNNSLCSSKSYLPYWCVNINEDFDAEFRFWWPAHNIGHWWNSILRLENSIDFLIPSEIETAMLQNLKLYFNNPDHICLCDLNGDKYSPEFELYSLRESLLGLTSLILYRNEEWAYDKARKMISKIDSVSQNPSKWNLKEFERIQKIENKSNIPFISPIETHGRFIEPLVWFFEVTGNASAIELAGRFVEFHLNHTFLRDGHLSSEIDYPHVHSLLNTIYGILYYGVATRQQTLVNFISKSIKIIFPQFMTNSGVFSGQFGNHFETGSPGIAAQIGLLLAKQGYSEFLDIAERIIRARLLPSQIIEPVKLNPKNSNKFSENREISNRVVGAFGGVHYDPHSGKRPTTNITASNIHSLAEIYDNITEITPFGLRINFHFDYEDEHVKIVDRRSETAKVSIFPKISQTIWIRIPEWIRVDLVRIMIEGRIVTPCLIGNFICFEKVKPEQEIMLMYDLPKKTILEKTNGKVYQITWHGDDIVGIYPNSDVLPFYQTEEEKVFSEMNEAAMVMT